MPLTVCVRNELQCLNYDLSLMLAHNRPPREIVVFLAKRMRNLTSPPSYINLDWDTSAQRVGTPHDDVATEEDGMMKCDDIGDVLLFGVKLE